MEKKGEFETYVLRHPDVGYAILMYRWSWPTPDDIACVLAKHGVNRADLDGVMVNVEARYNFGMGKLPRNVGVYVDAEEVRQNHRLAELWREALDAEQKPKKKIDDARSGRRRQQRQISDSSGPDSVEARDGVGGAAGGVATHDRAEGRPIDGDGDAGKPSYDARKYPL